MYSMEEIVRFCAPFNRITWLELDDGAPRCFVVFYVKLLAVPLNEVFHSFFDRFSLFLSYCSLDFILYFALRHELDCTCLVSTRATKWMYIVVDSITFVNLAFNLTLALYITLHNFSLDLSLPTS